MMITGNNKICSQSFDMVMDQLGKQMKDLTHTHTNTRTYIDLSEMSVWLNIIVVIV